MLNNWFAERRIESLHLSPDCTVPLHFSEPRAEHLATRAAAGLFDYSFMGFFEFEGPGARACLERLQTRRLSRIDAGALFYTLLLLEDGNVLNDATLWCLGPQRYWLFTGRRWDYSWLKSRCGGFDVELRDHSGQFSVLALQGPRSPAILQGLLAPGTIAALRYFRFITAEIAGAACRIGRLGYSGELGYEIVVPAAQGADLWRALLAAGKDAGMAECGFKAADSLRIESGHVLYSRELGPRLNPYELGMERLLDLHGRDFIGAAALRARRHRQPVRCLAGIVPLAGSRKRGRARSLPRAQMTSEAHSPIFACNLALGFVATEALRPGSLLQLADGRLARSARLPFYDPGRVLPRRLGEF
jgi:aminomethyltransferase